MKFDLAEKLQALVIQYKKAHALIAIAVETGSLVVIKTDGNMWLLKDIRLEHTHIRHERAELLISGEITEDRSDGVTFPMNLIKAVSKFMSESYKTGQVIWPIQGD